MKMQVDSPDDRYDDKDSEAYSDPDDTEEGYNDAHDDEDGEEDDENNANDNDGDDGEDDEDDNDGDDNNKDDRIKDREGRYVYRCYAIPRFIIEEEQSLLKRYKLETLQELFSKVYEDFYTIAILMKYYNSSMVIEDINEEVLIQMIGRQLLQFLDCFGSVCSVFADFDETILST